MDMGGCNSNLTVRQFSAAYKRLLLAHNNMLDIASGNCFSLESVPILSVPSLCNDAVTQYFVRYINTSIAKSRVRCETTKVHAYNAEEN